VARSRKRRAVPARLSLELKRIARWQLAQPWNAEGSDKTDVVTSILPGIRLIEMLRKARPLDEHD
jgi:hypothetical protein